MVRHRAGLVFVAAVLLFDAAGCSPTHHTSAAAPRPAITLEPAAPGGPILLLDTWCGGGCAGGLASMLDFVELVVYADGRALVGSPGQSTWWMTDGVLRSDEFTRARGLAGQVLTSDTIRGRPNTGTADGPVERLLGWSKGKVLHTNTGVRLFPEDNTGSPDQARIDAMNAFVALVAGAVTARGHTYSPTSLALFTEPSRTQDAEAPWPGPSLASFGDHIGSPDLTPRDAPIVTPQLVPRDVRCGLLGDLPSTLLPSLLGPDRSRVWSTGSGSFEVLVRPLLPHENTCDQAFSV